MLPGDTGPQPAGPNMIGPALIGPMAPTPPQTPAEVEQNKGLWRTFLDRMKTDPQFKMSVQQTAIGMMKSPQIGQNSFDVLGNALQGGITTLDTLRQRERTQKIEDEERKRKAGIENRQTAAQETTAAATAKRADTEVSALEAQKGQWGKQYDLDREKLQEAIRSNKATEEINRLKAQADATRARAYSEGRAGRTPAEIQKINMLSAQYQAQGMDPVDADALAIQYLQETGKGKGPGDRVRAAVDARMKSYNSSLASLDKPIDADMIRQWTEEAIQLDAKTEQMLNQTNVPAPTGTRNTPDAGVFGAAPAMPSSADFAAQPNEPAAPSSATAPPPPPNPALVPGAGNGGMTTGVVPDPRIAAEVQAAIRARKDPAAIRQRLVERGLDPALYGL